MKAAIIGGGVIGGGWAARFLLNGWDVDVFDVDPEAERKINTVLENARLALPQIYDRPLPKEGQLRFTPDIEEAVSHADWVQESVSESLDLKHKVLKEISDHAPEHALIGSSTSGFKPSELRAEGARVFVAHPFNPVYLLPLIELVGAPEKAGEILRSIGCYPLFIEKEIDAHIADRLLEAVWREALWLIHDEVASTKDIDEAIRMGFGLRWAQMGLFETYRIAGGEGGMKHFLNQFGPALEWNWTKLMDVPEFNEALIERIASQSDSQSGHLSIRELERQRDVNLIAFLRHLKAQKWGAGAVVLDHEALLEPAISAVEDGKIMTNSGHVLPAWIDYNGHMTEFRYAQILADGGDNFLTLSGLDADVLKQYGSYFTAESHVSYLVEMKLGEAFSIEAQLLYFDEKRIHLYQRVLNAEEICVATGEHLYLFVDSATGKVAQAPDFIRENLANLYSVFDGMDWPENAGKVGKRLQS